MDVTRGRIRSERNDLTFPIDVSGRVIHGDRRGRSLGYPTANVACPVEVVAPEGVFVGVVRRADGTRYASAVSVGRRETFYDGIAPSLVEAYLLDFDGDLYGETLVVYLLDMLREQTRFDSVDTLVQQIRDDVAEVRELVDETTLAHFTELALATDADAPFAVNDRGSVRQRAQRQTAAALPVSAMGPLS